MALPRQTLGPRVCDRGASEADQRYKAAQEQVYLVDVGKLFQHTGAHKAIVGMVVHDLGPHGRQQLIKALCGKALEEGIGLPARADPVYHLIALQIPLDHLVHGVQVVLAVTVDRDGDVAAVLGLHESGQNGVLVAAVAALRDADKVGVLPGQRADDVPCLVAAAVVDEEHAAVIADLARRDEVLKLLQKQRRRDRQDRLLVVAGNDDIQDRRHKETSSSKRYAVSADTVLK